VRLEGRKTRNRCKAATNDTSLFGLLSSSIRVHMCKAMKTVGEDAKSSPISEHIQREIAQRDVKKESRWWHIQCIRHEKVDSKVRRSLVTRTRPSAASSLQPLVLGLLAPLNSYSLIRRRSDVADVQDGLRAVPPSETHNARPRVVCGLELVWGERQRQATQ
jgi:hypothetical protein